MARFRPSLWRWLEFVSHQVLRAQVGLNLITRFWGFSFLFLFLFLFRSRFATILRQPHRVVGIITEKGTRPSQ